MHSTIENHLLHLERMGTARVSHRNGTLLQHLHGVWALLDEWQNPEAICLAGLYHSVYSTGGFEQQLIPLDRRHQIVDKIGADAERIVYLFAACDRPVTHPRIGKQKPTLFRDRFSNTDYPLEHNEWCAICEIMLANELDLGRYDPNYYRKHLSHFNDLFTRFEPWLSPAAIAAKDNFDNKDPVSGDFPELAS